MNRRHSKVLQAMCAPKVDTESHLHLEPEGGKKLPGVLETYVVGEPGDPTPLLLSQHAQAALGLVKDMATSTCTLGRNGPTLKLHRTKDSGLLCV